MTKITKVPIDVLKGQNHPIVPRDVDDAEITFVEEEGHAFIIFQTSGGSVVFGDDCNMVKYRADGDLSGSILTTEPLQIGSSVWESAKRAIENYISAKKGAK